MTKPPLKNKEESQSVSCKSFDWRVLECYEFFKFLLKHFSTILNNIGVIYTLRNKFAEGMQAFSRAILGRILDLDSYVSLYQAALLEINVRVGGGKEWLDFV